MKNLLHSYGLLMCAISACSFFCPTHVSAEEASAYTRLEVTDPFAAALLSRPQLMAGSAEIIDIAGYGTYLVGVGVTINKDPDGNNPKGRMDMMTVAKAKARKNMVAFLESEIISTESLKVTRVSKDSTGESVVSQKTSSRTKVLTTEILEKTKGVLRFCKSIGSWYSTDYGLYYAASAILIEPADGTSEATITE